MVSVVNLNSCKTKEPREPWAPLIYAGDHEAKALKRDQAKESIECADIKFSEMFCMFENDMRTMLDRCISAKEAQQTWALFGGADDEQPKPDDSKEAESSKPTE